MTDPRKPANKNTAKALLDELTSIRSLLNDGDELADGNKDVPHSSLLDDEVPLLEPLEAAEAGDGHQQMPLLGSTSSAAMEQDAPPVHKALAERENPFLPRKPLNVSAAAPLASAPPLHSSQPDDERLRTLIDETLAEWLPKIEQDLRQRLRTLLKKPS